MRHQRCWIKSKGKMTLLIVMGTLLVQNLTLLSSLRISVGLENLFATRSGT